MNHDTHHMILQPGAMTLPELRAVWSAPGLLRLASGAYAAIEASAATVQAIVAKGDPAYGINTGFGLLAKRHIRKPSSSSCSRT
jgi:histidine ammonia-lyase